MNGSIRLRRGTETIAMFRRLLREGLEPRRAAAAVWLGVALGIIPIYGLQSVMALLLARLFGLNPLLTLGATFINNPLLQPFLVLSSLQLGHLVTRGEWMSISWSALTASGVMSQLAALLVGSFLLSGIIGAPAAAFTYVLFAMRKRDNRASRRTMGGDWQAYVNDRFSREHRYARGFVRWKMRLDRVFSILASRDLGSGPVVDLGCGYGAALALVAYRDPGRELAGCDLAERRVEAARGALAGLADVCVADIRTYPIRPSGLVLILDVLQYMPAEDQFAVLRRCAEALLPGGSLIFRLPDQGSRLMGLTGALDWVCLRLAGSKARPAYVPVDAYTRMLTEAGLRVDVRRYRNRLPLAHVLVSALKPPIIA